MVGGKRRRSQHVEDIKLTGLWTRMKAQHRLVGRTVLTMPRGVGWGLRSPLQQQRRPTPSSQKGAALSLWIYGLMASPRTRLTASRTAEAAAAGSGQCRSFMGGLSSTSHTSPPDTPGVPMPAEAVVPVGASSFHGGRIPRPRFCLSTCQRPPLLPPASWLRSSTRLRAPLPKGGGGRRGRCGCTRWRC